LACHFKNNLNVISWAEAFSDEAMKCSAANCTAPFLMCTVSSTSPSSRLCFSQTQIISLVLSKYSDLQNSVTLSFYLMKEKDL